jgi:FMN-dependent NADH-azoreductase
MKFLDYQEPYLRATLGFIGLTDIDTIDIEGVVMGAEAALDKAKQYTYDLTHNMALSSQH